MLSKTEREFLQGNYHPSTNHKRFLRHKIKKKLREFYQLELPLIQNSSVSDFTNVVSDFTNGNFKNFKKQSLGRGTNPRPNAYEALTQFIFVNMLRFDH